MANNNNNTPKMPWGAKVFYSVLAVGIVAFLATMFGPNINIGVNTRTPTATANTVTVNSGDFDDIDLDFTVTDKDVIEAEADFDRYSDVLIDTSMPNKNAYRKAASGFSEAVSDPFEAPWSDPCALYEELKSEIMGNPVVCSMIIEAYGPKVLPSGNTISSSNPWMGEFVSLTDANGMLYWLTKKPDGSGGYILKANGKPQIFVSEEYRGYAMRVCLLLDNLLIHGVESWQASEHWCHNNSSEPALVRTNICTHGVDKEDALILKYVFKEGCVGLWVGFNLWDKRIEFFPPPTCTPSTPYTPYTPPDEPPPPSDKVISDGPTRNPGVSNDTKPSASNTGNGNTVSPADGSKVPNGYQGDEAAAKAAAAKAAADAEAARAAEQAATDAAARVAAEEAARQKAADEEAARRAEEAAKNPGKGVTPSPGFMD